MSAALSAVRNQLDAIGFRVRVGGWAPFGEALPLVTAVAWDESTAQLVLVAEETEECGDEDWRQLLFAGGALRHHLSESGPAGFGAPVVLAIVSEDGQQQLRQLAEDLVRDYVIFARVDLNLVPPQAIEDQDLLELALAPLLPRCRKTLGQEISKGEIDRFWDRLAAEIRKAADGLPEMFGDARAAAAERAIGVLIGDERGGSQLPAPQPVSALLVQNFRSFRSAEAELTGATVICGANGSGKTSLMEALELHWAKTSQRKPSDESAASYARHLATDGLGEFSVTADGEITSSVSDAPQVQLARNVLPYDALRDVVTSKPDDRYSALLATTGLEVPDVKDRTARLVELTRHDADRAFSLLGLEALPRATTNAYDHLLDGLRTPTHSGLPAADGVAGAELALAQASGHAYQPRSWMSDADALRALEAADLEVARVIGGEHSSRLAATLDAAVDALQKLMDERRDALRPLRALLAAIEMPREATQAEPPPSADQQEPEVIRELPASLAARWLAHANTLSHAALEFAEQAETVENAEWRGRVQAYADALRAAAEQAPRKQLQEWAAPAAPPPPGPPPASPLDPQLSLTAGFTRPVPERSLVAPLRQLVEAIEDYGRGLRMVADQLAAHPARVFADNRGQVIEAVSAFELARKLRLAGPIMAASQQLVGELLRDRLFPVVRELAAAMVRFEWYFKPLKIPDTGRRVVLSGLSTSSDDLDARMVLNAAEATALGIAWFLALHMLQPAERRAVLVLDDPVSVFDPANLGGFVSTLRTFVRLTRPQQLIVATHDDAVAAILADELTPVEGWPTAVSLLRCERDRDDRSVVRVRYTNSEPAGLEGELQRLGLMTTA